MVGVGTWGAGEAGGSSGVGGELTGGAGGGGHVITI